MCNMHSVNSKRNQRRPNVQGKLIDVHSYIPRKQAIGIMQLGRFGNVFYIFKNYLPVSD